MSKQSSDYFVVVGYYPDNNQPFCSSYDADDCDRWQDAVDLCRLDITVPLVVVAVLDDSGFSVDDLQETLQIEPLDEESDRE